MLPQVTGFFFANRDGNTGEHWSTDQQLETAKREQPDGGTGADGVLLCIKDYASEGTIIRQSA
jgi:hypothetical protein